MGDNTFNQLGILLTIYLFLSVFGSDFGLIVVSDFFTPRYISYNPSALEFLFKLIWSPLLLVFDVLRNSPVGLIFDIILNIIFLPATIFMSDIPIFLKIILDFIAILTWIAVAIFIRGK